jgi:hypothetical protein
MGTLAPCGRNAAVGQHILGDLLAGQHQLAALAFTELAQTVGLPQDFVRLILQKRKHRTKRRKLTMVVHKIHPD